MTTSRPKRESLKKCIAVYVALVPIIGLVLFYGLFHLGLGIPLASLWRPYAMISAITLLACPSLYWAIGDPEHIHDNRKRRIPVLLGYFWAGMVVYIHLYIHYGERVGIIESEDEIPVLILATFMLLAGGLIAYRMGGKANANVSEDNESIHNGGEKTNDRNQDTR